MEIDNEQAQGWFAFFVGLLWAIREALGWGVRRRRQITETEAAIDPAETARKIMDELDVDIDRRIRQANDKLQEEISRDRAIMRRIVTDLRARLDTADREREEILRLLRAGNANG